MDAKYHWGLIDFFYVGLILEIHRYSPDWPAKAISVIEIALDKYAHWVHVEGGVIFFCFDLFNDTEIHRYSPVQPAEAIPCRRKCS